MTLFTLVLLCSILCLQCSSGATQWNNLPFQVTGAWIRQDIGDVQEQDSYKVSQSLVIRLNNSKVEIIESGPDERVTISFLSYVTYC